MRAAISGPSRLRSQLPALTAQSALDIERMSCSVPVSFMEASNWLKTGSTAGYSTRR